MTEPRILISVPNGAEEIETLTVADILVRAGCAVTLAGHDTQTPTGSRGLPLRTDVLLKDVADERWDLLYLPGGLPAAEAHSTSAVIQNLLQTRLEEQLLTAIICASPQALLPQHLARGRTLTSFPALKDKMQEGGAHWQNQAVVKDGALITSQGPGTSAALGLALAALVTDASNAASVASAALFNNSWQKAQQIL